MPAPVELPFVCEVASSAHRAQLSPAKIYQNREFDFLIFWIQANCLTSCVIYKNHLSKITVGNFTKIIFKADFLHTSSTFNFS